MKMVISLVLIVLLCLSITFCYDDIDKPLYGFELHNGTKFFMSSSEIIRLEELAGITITKGMVVNWQDYERYDGKCAIEGIKNSTIQYIIKDDKLVQFRIAFNDKAINFSRIEDILTQRYGEPSFFGRLDVGYHVYAFNSVADVNKTKQRLVYVTRLGDIAYCVAIDHYVLFDTLHEVSFTILECDVDS